MKSKIKFLEKLFTFEQLKVECLKQGWRLPTISDLSNTTLSYHVFVDEPVEDDHYAVMWDGKTKVLVNRHSFLERAAVIKLPCLWVVLDEAYATTSCGRNTIHQYGYKYCPYCGREIKFNQKET